MIETKSWSGGVDEEYETQHFGFGAQRLKIAVRLMIEQKIRIGVKDMESFLQESLDLNETDKTTLRHSCDKIIRLYCDRASPSLEIIDNEIDGMLKIPNNVLLPGNEIQIEQVTNEECDKLKEEIVSLRQRVERGALMEALLKAEEKELSSMEKLCEIAKKDLEVIDLLQKTCDNGDIIKSIQNEVKFLSASIPCSDKNKDDSFED